jgi:chromosome segregation ATPase
LKPISGSIKTEVLRRWLNGETYQRISEETGVSMGAISEIIEEYRQKAPDIDGLRQLRLALGKAKASLPDALRGAQFLTKIDELQFDSKYLPGCLALIKQAGERAPELITASARLIDLEQRAKKPYEQFLQQFNQQLAAETELKGRVRTLEDKELNLANSIRHLDKLNALQQTIETNKITPTILETLIDDELRLQKLGFTTQDAEILAQELAKRKLDPNIASMQIASLLQECSSLEEAKEKAQAEARKWASERDKAQQEAELLKEKCLGRRNEIQRLEEAYKERKQLLENGHQALKEGLKADHDATKQTLDADLLKRLQEKESQVQDLQTKAGTLRAEIEGLESTKATAMKELQIANANKSEAEAALQTIKEAVDKSKGLATVVSLIQNPTALENRPQVLETMIAILQGFRTYLKLTYPNGWKKGIDLVIALDHLREGLVGEMR